MQFERLIGNVFFIANSIKDMYVSNKNGKLVFNKTRLEAIPFKADFTDSIGENITEAQGSYQKLTGSNDILSLSSLDKDEKVFIEKKDNDILIKKGNKCLNQSLQFATCGKNSEGFRIVEKNFYDIFKYNENFYIKYLHKNSYLQSSKSGGTLTITEKLENSLKFYLNSKSTKESHKIVILKDNKEMALEQVAKKSDIKAINNSIQQNFFIENTPKGYLIKSLGNTYCACIHSDLMVFETPCSSRLNHQFFEILSEKEFEVKNKNELPKPEPILDSGKYARDFVLKDVETNKYFGLENSEIISLVDKKDAATLRLINHNIPLGTYSIEIKGKNKVIDFAFGNSKSLIPYNFHGGKNQQFSFEFRNKIVLIKQDGLCATSKGTNITFESCSPIAANQQFATEYSN